jgi:hypothetical protein
MTRTAIAAACVPAISTIERRASTMRRDETAASSGDKEASNACDHCSPDAGLRHGVAAH